MLVALAIFAWLMSIVAPWWQSGIVTLLVLAAIWWSTRGEASRARLPWVWLMIFLELFWLIRIVLEARV